MVVRNVALFILVSFHLFHVLVHVVQLVQLLCIWCKVSLHLISLEGDCDGEEDADCQTKVAAALGDVVDQHGEAGNAQGNLRIIGVLQIRRGQPDSEGWHV